MDFKNISVSFNPSEFGGGFTIGNMTIDGGYSDEDGFHWGFSYMGSNGYIHGLNIGANPSKTIPMVMAAAGEWLPYLEFGL